MLEIIAMQLLGDIHHEMTVVSSNTVGAIEFDSFEGEYIVSGWSLISGEMISENFFGTLEEAREFLTNRNSRSYWVTSQDCGSHRVGTQHPPCFVWLRDSLPSYEGHR